MSRVLWSAVICALIISAAAVGGEKQSGEMRREQLQSRILSVLALKQKSEGQAPSAVAPAVPASGPSVVYVDASYTSGSSGGHTWQLDAFNKIQDGIDAVAAGGTVNVYPGMYIETASNRSPSSLPGTYTFGLYIGQAKNGITVQGVTAGGAPITDYHNILASVQTEATNNFGPDGVFMEGDNVTISGLKIWQDTALGTNKTVTVVGDNFTLQYCHITDFTSPSNSGPWGSVYIDDEMYNATLNISHIQRYTIRGNWLENCSIDPNNGAGYTGAASGRVITNNTIDLGSWAGASISFSGSGTGVPWFIHGVGGAVITGNSFLHNSQHIRARGTYDNTQFDWASYFNSNTFDHSVVVGSAPPATLEEYSYTGGYGPINHVRRIGGIVQGEINHGLAADVVLVGPGTYEEQLVMAQQLTLQGTSTASTIIKSPTTLTAYFTTSANNYPIVYAHDADGITVTNLTVDGAGRGNGNYRFQGIGYFNAGGTISNCVIKDIRETPISGTQHGNGIYAYVNTATARTLNVTNNTIYGFQKNAMALNGTNLTANVSGNTVTGAGAVNFIAQNGIQIGFGGTGSITNNTVSGFSYTPSTDVACALLLYQSGGTITSSNNTINASQVGIYYIEVGGLISANTITASAASVGTTSFWGIDADPGGVPRLTADPVDGSLAAGKTVHTRNLAATITTSITQNVLTGDGVNGVGLEMDALGTDVLNVSATQNSIGAWANGVVFYSAAAATLNASVNGNSIAGNVFGVLNQTPSTQDASANWWGSASGPKVSSNPGGTGDSVSATVDYTPWLNGGTDTQIGTAGFQGDFLALDVSAASPQTGSTLRIQEGVNLVSAGGTVNVLPGIYVEAVDITKTLSLVGQAGAVVRPDNTTPLLDSGVRRPAIYVNAVNNVLVRGFELDGSGGDVHYGVYAFNSNNTVVKNNLIHDLKNDASGLAGVGVLYFGWGQIIDRARVDANTIFGTPRMGIWVGGMQSSAPYNFLETTNDTIVNNTVHDAWQGPTSDGGGAIQFNGGKNCLIGGNTVYNTGLTWYGVYIAGSAGTGNMILGNSIYSNPSGIVVWSNVTFVVYGADAAGAPGVHLNSIHGNSSYGLRNVDTGAAYTINATNNYWGSVHGPLDSIGTVEVPTSPVPPVASMKNAIPANHLGDRVSENVAYFPWSGPPTSHAHGGIWAGAYVNPVSNSIFAGIDAAALDGVDPMDTVAPPPPPTDYLYVYFLLDPGNPLPNYSVDVRKDEASLASRAKIWNLRAVTDHASSVVSIEFPISNLPPEFTPVLYDLTTGGYQNLKANSLYSYTSPATAGQVSSFMLYIGDSTKPAVTVTAPNGGEFLVAGQPSTITWTSSDGSGLLAHDVYYSLTGGAPYTLIGSVAGSVHSLPWTPPSASSSASIKVVARDSVLNEQFDVSDHSFTILSSNSVSFNASAGWNLVGVPMLQADMSPAGIFGDDYGVPYYTFQFSPSGGYSIPSTLAMGQGYWLGSNSAQAVDAVGTPLSAASHALLSGFNIIGNPFAASEPKDSLKFTDGISVKNMADAAAAGWLSNVLYGYSGGSYVVENTALGVWRGYWIPLLRGGITLEYVPSVTIPTPKLTPEEVSPRHWSLELAASLAVNDRTYGDRIAAFGVRSDAKEGMDARYDAPRPPRSPDQEYVEVSILSQGERYARNFAKSERPGWEIEVSASSEGSVTLSWDNSMIRTLPAEVKIEMRDVENHRVVDMKKEASYTYAQVGTSHRFLINRSGSPGAPEVPKTYVLGQNYPNPFNPTTRISFSLPVDARVKLEVFDLLGQKLVELVNGEMNSGTHDVRFDAGALPSGVYVYRMDALGHDGTRYSATQHMLLLK